MIAVITGQVGLDKKAFLECVVDRAREDGHDVVLCNVGDMMYAEAPDVARGRILDLPLSRLNSLRRSVFKDIIVACREHEHVLINTHATFRWRHGLFYAFDYDQMRAIDADLYVALIDNIDRVHYRLSRDRQIGHSLKDLMVWREEEVMATELLSQIVRGHGRFFIMSRDADNADSPAVEAIVRLMFQPDMRKVYLSFPMSHVQNMPDMLAEIEGFRREMKRYFTCFDPADVDEKYLHAVALEAVQDGRKTFAVGPADQRCTLDTNGVLEIIHDIDGQIYVRDFKLIDQADMIVSLIPELPDGRPGISSGVERELQHAHEAAKDVFVVWCPQAEPSPFVTETATRVFRSIRDALQHFQEQGQIPATPGGALFE